MKESLLSHIASNFISEYENVANSSISYLLNKYPQAREALKKILSISDVPNYYITELSTQNNGRPDVTGKDTDGNKIVIIEGKFWARLTNNQPVNYLKELNDNGRLLFLVPNKRIRFLKLDIKNRLKGDDNRIVICSWDSFLSLVELENSRIHDSQLASDLLQLKELCKKMEEEGITPLSMSDLDPINGRLIYNFSNLMDECNSLLRKWDEANFKGMKTTPTKEGYGFYFRAFDFSCYLGFSSYDWFSKDSHTPVWLYIQDGKWKKSERIYHFLNILDPKNSYDEKDKSSYGIVLKAGMDKEQVITYIANKTEEVLKFLNEKINYGKKRIT